MTFEQLIQAYMQARRELLERGAPLGDWTVSMSPADVECLQMEKNDHVIAGEHVYGATWVQDAKVPPGELWITMQARPTTHVVKVTA